MSGHVILDTRALACERGGVPLIEGLDLTLRAGEALVLRGPNGIGKTTLLRTLAGLQPARAGAMSAPPDTIAYAAHADGLKPTLTAAENLRFWARVHGDAPIEPALEQLDLTALRDRAAQNLSAGQKRRLGLARLLVTGRAIWMLDEPTVSLDAASVRLFVSVIEGHLAGGGAALIATHIDLGLSGARVLDLAPYRAAVPEMGGADAFDEAFT